MSDPLTDLLDEYERTVYKRKPSLGNLVLAEHIYVWLQGLRKPKNYPCPTCEAEPGQPCRDSQGFHLRRAELMNKTFHEVIGVRGWDQQWKSD